MELLKQCQKWNKNDEFQKIIDALEAVPAGERSPEMDSELARAYENIAEPGEMCIRDSINDLNLVEQPKESASHSLYPISKRVLRREDSKTDALSLGCLLYTSLTP